MYKVYKGHKTGKVAKIIETQKKANVDIKGLVTYKQGILSKFTSDTVITIPSKFVTSRTDSWEIVLKFKTAPEFTRNQMLLEGTKNGARCLLVTVGSTGKIIIYLQSSTDGGTQTFSSLTLNVLTDYYLKIVFDGTKYTYDISEDKQQWTNYITVPKSLPIYDSVTYQISSDTLNTFWQGSIDLNESYININGERWWNGVTDKDVSYASYKIIQEIK